jgi:hypothetical protein
MTHFQRHGRSPAAPPRVTSIFSRYFYRRLFHDGKLRRIFIERLSEPLHMNVIALMIALFGSFRMKVLFDLIVRPQYAFPILYAADEAKRLGIAGITVAEFGVANGAGLMCMCQIADAVYEETGVEVHVVGFDTGTGMPSAVDYRDIPDAFHAGDFPMDIDRLRDALPASARLVLGPVKETVPAFLASLSSYSPLGFVAVDVDYYSSTVDALTVFDGPQDVYLPRVTTYLDDISIDQASPWVGELLAVHEFNESHEMRKIAPFQSLRAKRPFKNALWIEQMFVTHVFDRPSETAARNQRSHVSIIPNEFIE